MNDTELCNLVCQFIDGEFDADTLQEYILWEYGEKEVFTSFAIDIIRLVDMRLSNAELRVRLARVVDRSTLGLSSVA